MIDLIKEFIDFVLHLDRELPILVANYHNWVYAILFLIIFCETGLIVTPFLPGDSLLFAAGAVAAMPNHPLNPALIIILLMIAAFSGDNTNYFVGKFIGKKIYEKDYKLIKKQYIDKTHQFYEKYGKVAIIFARFMPILRTFAPFVAGIGTMKYKHFWIFSIAGNVLWVNLFVLAGYFFGNIPIIKNNFSLVILAIIGISLIPPLIAVIKQKLSKA